MHHLKVGGRPKDKGDGTADTAKPVLPLRQETAQGTFFTIGGPLSSWVEFDILN
jgi:hypothetical protein